MGWIEYSRHEHIADPKAECDRLITWDREDSKGEVLASSLVGNVYYAAHRRTDAGKEPWTAGVVLLIHRSPFAYKDMDEGMGPCEDRCPKYILELLSELPPRDPQTCSTCEGSGKLKGDRTCYVCHGEGARDARDYARGWRERCWARFGGEPPKVKIALPASHFS